MTNDEQESPEKKSYTNIKCLPSEKIPSCWNDDQRMNALFAPFRSKSANPQDWCSKYKFWHNTIFGWLNHRLECSFSIADLNEAFKRNGCTPLCLTTVIEELHRNNEIILEEDFVKEPTTTWTGWSIDVFVRKPFKWSVSRLKNYVTTQQLDVKTKYIHVKILKELGDTLLSTLGNENENILMPFTQVMEGCRKKSNKQDITDTSFKLALLWLTRLKKADFCEDNIKNNNELLVKISSNNLQKITEAEKDLYRLLQQEVQVIEDIKSMEHEKLNLTQEARICLSKNLRELAKVHLRKKQELDKIITKRAHALENLQVLVSNIQDMHANSAILNAYKTGSNVLKQITDNELPGDLVREVMDDMFDTLEDYKETQSILSDTLNTSDIDPELERELAELLELDESTAKTGNVISTNQISDAMSKMNISANIKDLKPHTKPSQNKDVHLAKQTAGKPSVSSLEKKLIKQADCSQTS